VFERFTERARQVVVLAQDEARALGHNYIGTEHILLGLLREEEGIAARALERLGVTLAETRVLVGEFSGPREEPPAGQIPFTPRTKAVLELSLREALALGHNHIGTEHILLGLVRESGGLGARILLGFGADPEQVRGEVIGMLAGPGVGAAAFPDPGWAAYPEADLPSRGESRIPLHLLVGWALFAIAFGLGLLAGWLIWG
jgi:ATP-dependent Clp protease ATP-binding subunit ClpC